MGIDSSKLSWIVPPWRFSAKAIQQSYRAAGVSRSGIPSGATSASLANARGFPTDIYDIDAMSLAVPYCDLVVAEKACHHVLNVARLGERMHTALLRDPRDLPSTLDQWEPA